MRRHGEAATETDAAIHRFGDVEVDTGRAEVRRDGVPVDVTPLEFQLLETFVRRRGRALTREQLLDAVWGPDVHVTDRAVDAPDRATIADAIVRLCFLAKIEEGLRQSDARQLVSHDQVKRQFRS